MEAMLGQNSIGSRPAPRARKDLVLQELGTEGLLYDREGSLVHILNLTALHAWRLCDGSRTTDEIAEAVRATFAGTEKRDVRGDVEELLARFSERGLLERT